MLTITIDWIRHATSCANVLKRIDNETGENKTSEYVPDTLLTDFGKQQSYNVGEIYKDVFKDYKYIFTSNLRRTIETAFYFFKSYNKKHVILPILFVQELREEFKNDKENIPSDILDIEKWTNTISDDLSKINLIFLKYLITITNNQQIVNKPDFTNFVKYVLGYMIDNNLLKDRDKIVVFTHRCFIEKHLSISNVNNLDIFSEKITLKKNKEWQVINKVPFYKRTKHLPLKQLSIEDEKNYTDCGEKAVEYINNSNKRKIGIIDYLSHVLFKYKLLHNINNTS
jgi:bisphosphoglycerate-dependent phosphoglycerate mutase